ncbi:MAG: alginate export family protein [Bacteroidota bacterium]|nr:alginate export family protein [Bacteroidota bacterium]
MKSTSTTLKKTVLLLFASLICSVSFAQLTLSGDLRPRFEYRHGYKALYKDSTEAASFISQRTRINLGYKDKNYTVGISFQDVRVWGDNSLANASDNNSSFHEAWAELRIANRLFVKIGRQELVYDDNRLFSNGEWSIQGRSHDMALLKWNPDTTLKINLGLAFNQNKEQTDTRAYTVANNYKAMQLFWMHKDWNENGVSLIFANIGNEQLQTISPGILKHHIRYFQTFGGKYSYKDKHIGIDGAVYLQTGKDPTNRTINANYACLDIPVSLNKQWSIIPKAEHFSGTSTKDISLLKTNQSFNPLFGGAHRINGTMDYFYCSNHLDNVGLNDYSLSINYVKNRFSPIFTTHLFYADARVSNLADEKETLGKKLGTELDFQFVYRVNANVTCTCGYSQMFATNTMEVVKGGDKNNTNNYAFLMFSFKPEFIK